MTLSPSVQPGGGKGPESQVLPLKDKLHRDGGKRDNSHVIGFSPPLTPGSDASSAAGWNAVSLEFLRNSSSPRQQNGNEKVRKTVLEIAGIALISLIAGTVYIGATGKLEFFVKPDRYPDALVCRRSGNGEGKTPPKTGIVKGSPEGKNIPAPKAPSTTEPAPSVAPPPPKPAATQEGKETGGSAAGSDESDVPLVDFEEVRAAWTERILFIDARSPKQYGEGHIPGAISIPAWEPGLEEKIRRLAETGAVEEPVIVYCTRARECEDSHIVASNLKEFGFQDVSIYEGGFGEWSVEKGMPVKKGSQPGERGPTEGGGEDR